MEECFVLVLASVLLVGAKQNRINGSNLDILYGINLPLVVVLELATEKYVKD